MKKIISYTLITVMLVVVSTSCEDVLDQKAVDSFNQETVFEDINLAKAFLGHCYDNIGGTQRWGGAVLGLRPNMLSSATDETLENWGPGGHVYIKEGVSPDNGGFFALNAPWPYYINYVMWNPLYTNIKNVNVLLASIDDVPVDLETDLKLRERIKAEAYFIRAFGYANLMRSYGGLVLIDEPFELDQDFLSIQRSSIDETLDFILSDLDKAIAGLPEKDGIEQGRATKGAAAALKSRILSWSTGILMNGGYEPSNPLVSFQSGSRTQKLEAAKTAAKQIIDGQYGHYALTGSTEDPPTNMSEEEVMAYADNFYSIFVQKGAWNDEVFWGVQHLQSQGNTVQTNKWNGPNGYHNWGGNQPTEPIIRRFEMKDGTPFQWDKYNPGDNLTREANATELAEDPEINPYVGREPRFYATILFDGAKWQTRPSDAFENDPEGIIQTGYFIQEDGSEVVGLDTRESYMESWNGTRTGYYLKKYLDIEIDGQYYNNENTWIELRYAEVILDYAEACIELGDVQEGLDALNMVRNRAGLPDRVTTDQDQAREWYRKERQLEFIGEGDRWYMMRKWMIADQAIENVHPIRIFHYHDGSKKWFYNTSITSDNRSWANDRQYFLPIPRDEMNKAPQLTNNPGY
jgi:hypothetical protein